MPEPYLTSHGKLSPHWHTLREEIKAANRKGIKDVDLTAEATATMLVASLSGKETRRANRHRGDPIPVIPFRQIGADWDAWFGYREVWKPTSQSRFAFSSADLTIFFAPVETEAFEQVLRAEWMGPNELDTNIWSFRPENAGHPHWQIDVTETLQANADYQSAMELVRAPDVPREFGVEPEKSSPVAPWINLGRIHFASSMRPWLDSHIAHRPQDLGQIRQWVISTLSILDSEFERL